VTPVVWRPGETIVHQEFWRGRLWAARPLTVVEDTGDRLVLWIPQGTVRKVPVTPPDRPDPPVRKDKVIANLDRCDWVLGEHVWDVSSLWIVRPGDWHAVWVSWLESGDHLGWYVNLQMPYRRTAIGIEAMDLMLDVVVEPDLSWQWKDDDEFAEILQRGIFDHDTGARVRREAEDVIRRIGEGDPRFAAPWPSWRPDPAWPLPVLPDGWDRQAR
jgi:protein associated with RNAse G/E